MSEFPEDILVRAVEAAKRCDTEYWAREIIAAEIFGERQRCIQAIIDASEPGKYMPIAEYVRAIKGGAS